MGRGPIYALAITVVVLLVAGAWWLRADGTAHGKVPAAATGDSASAGPAVRRSDRPAPGSPSTHGASTATTLH